MTRSAFNVHAVKYIEISFSTSSAANSLGTRYCWVYAVIKRGVAQSQFPKLISCFSNGFYLAICYYCCSFRNSFWLKQCDPIYDEKCVRVLRPVWEEGWGWDLQKDLSTQFLWNVSGVWVLNFLIFLRKFQPNSLLPVMDLMDSDTKRAMLAIKTQGVPWVFTADSTLC